MPNKDLVESILKNVENLESEDFDVLLVSGGRAQAWQNQKVDEIETLIHDTLNVLRTALKEELLENIPFNLLNGISTNLNNFFTQYSNLKGTAPDQIQNQHHQPLAQLQSTNTHIRQSGVYALAILGPDIEAKRTSIDDQLSKVSQANADIVKLKDQIKSLINPAAADSLSSAFDNRRSKISTQKWIWAIIVAISVGIAMYVTYDVTNSITNLVNHIESEVPAKDENSSPSTQYDFPLVWFMRILLLAPSYLLVFFSFRQYVKERMLEENYAHKSAIAQTLPSYSELVTDNQVKDEITSSATRVAFQLPKTNEDSNKNSNPSTSLLNELSEKVERLLKLNVVDKP
ncbi:hypothetical protein [Kangiella shandongensis]|uniref:hypothetical protein n=1 Tax=Kangiella shandongensis TaxID=2763258 RepID=UPI001CBF250B|nr:hypothetical protein [Kangiella shandongensis]